MRATWVGTIAAALLLAPAASADWPVYGHDLANSRSAGSDGPAVAAAGGLKQAWAFNSSNGDVTGTPVVAGGTLVAGTNLGTIYALDAVTGKQRWSRDVGDQINGSAAIDLDAPGGPTAFVPVARLGSPHLLALDLATGAVRWDTVLLRADGADVYGSPVFWNGAVYIGTSGPNSDEATARGSVVALDEATGVMRWQTFTVPPGHDGGAVWSTPAIDPATGRLYVGTGNAYHEPAADTTDSMLVLDARSGELLAHHQVEGGDVWQMNMPFTGPDHDFGASANLITAPDGRSLVGEGNKDGSYYALDAQTWQPAWSANVGPSSAIGGILASTAYDGSRIYGTDSLNGHVWSLDRGGKPAWESDDGGTAVFSPPAVSNGVLYTANPSGFLITRDATTGAVLGRFPLGGPTLGGISVVGRAVYVSVGTGPPPQPLQQVDESKMDGAGAIVAFGDTSQSGAAPPSTLPARAAFDLSVAPRSVDAGQRTLFRFRARRGQRPLAGVAVRIAGHRVRTNRHGRATLSLTLPREGAYAVDAWRHGRGRVSTTVQVHGRPQPAAPPAHATSFDGSCTFTATVTFTPPLTNSPQDVRQDVTGNGKCNGTLVDRAGHSHQLTDEPVVYKDVADAKQVTCAAGIDSGTGSLGFAAGTLPFQFDEHRSGPLPLLHFQGAKGGEAYGTAAPSQSQDPSVALDCNGGGIKQFTLDGRLQTMSPLAG